MSMIAMVNVEEMPYSSMAADAEKETQVCPPALAQGAPISPLVIMLRLNIKASHMGRSQMTAVVSLPIARASVEGLLSLLPIADALVGAQA